MCWTKEACNNSSDKNMAESHTYTSLRPEKNVRDLLLRNIKKRQKTLTSNTSNLENGRCQIFGILLVSMRILSVRKSWWLVNMLEFHFLPWYAEYIRLFIDVGIEIFPSDPAGTKEISKCATNVPQKLNSYHMSRHWFRYLTLLVNVLLAEPAFFLIYDWS